MGFRLAGNFLIIIRRGRGGAVGLMRCFFFAFALGPDDDVNVCLAWNPIAIYAEGVDLIRISAFVIS